MPPLLESWYLGCIISSFSFDLIVKVLALSLFLCGFQFLVLCGISDLWMWVFNLLVDVGFQSMVVTCEGMGFDLRLWIRKTDKTEPHQC